MSNQRFSGAKWLPKIQELSVTVIGLGGVGSWFAPLMARVGPDKLVMYDDDLVEEVNLGGQMFTVGHNGEKKSDAAEDICRVFSSYYDAVNTGKKYKKGDPLTEIVVCCPDNMETRKTAFNEWRKMKDRKLFVDIRMTMEDYFIFAVEDEKDEKDYEQELFPSSEAEELDCNVRATSHCGAMAASRVVSLIINYADGNRPVPFRHHECLPISELLQ